MNVEQKLPALRVRLLKGKSSPIVNDFDPDAFLVDMIKKYVEEQASNSQKKTSS